MTNLHPDTQEVLNTFGKQAKDHWDKQHRQMLVNAGWNPTAVQVARESFVNGVQTGAAWLYLHLKATGRLVEEAENGR